MDIEHLRKRLAEMNRRPLGERSPADVSANAPLESGPREVSAPEPPGGKTASSPVSIEEVAPGRLVEVPRVGGAYWLIERRLSDIDPGVGVFFPPL